MVIGDLLPPPTYDSLVAQKADLESKLRDYRLRLQDLGWTVQGAAVSSPENIQKQAELKTGIQTLLGQLKNVNDAIPIAQAAPGSNQVTPEQLDASRSHEQGPPAWRPPPGMPQTDPQFQTWLQTPEGQAWQANPTPNYGLPPPPAVDPADAAAGGKYTWNGTAWVYKAGTSQAPPPPGPQGNAGPSPTDWRPSSDMPQADPKFQAWLLTPAGKAWQLNPSQPPIGGWGPSSTQNQGNVAPQITEPGAWGPRTTPYRANAAEVAARTAAALRASTRRANPSPWGSWRQNRARRASNPEPAADTMSGMRNPMAALAEGGTVHYGPTMLHINERQPSKTDKYAVDEFVYANPGPGGEVVVAPRLKSEAPTMKNAVRAIRRQRMIGKDMHAARFGTLVKAQEGTGVYQGGDYLTQLLAALTGGAGTSAMTELPLTQLAIMQAMGKINPAAFGITDPAEFRRLLTEGGQPTMQAQQQSWSQQQATDAAKAQAEQFAKTFGLQESLGLGQLGLSQAELAQKGTQFGQNLDLQKLLGMGDLDVRRMMAQAQASQAAGQLELGKGQLALGQGELGLKGELGRGQLALSKQDLEQRASEFLKTLGLNTELGRGNLALGQGQLGLQTELGRGNLALGQGQLGLQTELGRGSLANEGRRVALDEANAAYQRAIRGLKSLPAIGNVASGAPTFGNAGF